MDKGASQSQSPSSSTESVRSRWSPKPEQILILESIFNSGIVNPPKDETVRIRKMLEKFGAVGDANVFYWFQNRRSRSRRRQRQLQAATAAAATTRGAEDHQQMTTMSMHHHHQQHGDASEIDLGFGSCSNSSTNYNFLNGCSSSQVSSFYESNNNGMESNLSTKYGHESDHHHHISNAASILSPSDQNSKFHYHQGESFICMAHILFFFKINYTAKSWVLSSYISLIRPETKADFFFPLKQHFSNRLNY